MRGVKHTTVNSFKFAVEGFKTGLKQEPHLRFHFAIASIALIAGFVLKLSRLEWLMLAITIFLVIILELINTVLEALVDLVSPEIKDKAKVAKDVSAAAVLFAAIFSVIVGILLFGPKLFVLH